ncbi:MAG: hypothetical protein FGM37_11515 [Phycisphaerales bacterium]|nr:hypothetical protein [Phycisphaerales bacterium]
MPPAHARARAPRGARRRRPGTGCAPSWRCRAAPDAAPRGPRPPRAWPWPPPPCPAAPARARPPRRASPAAA